MTTYPLHRKNRHLFVELEGRKWLLDTGSPSSFGKFSLIEFAGAQHAVRSELEGLSAWSISQAVGVICVGLIGMDILRHFDFSFDVQGKKLTVSSGRLDVSGEQIHLESLMGIPIVTGEIRGREFRMFLDTGAQYSYLQDDLLLQFPRLERVTDFYPMIGEFEIETHEVPLKLGETEFSVCCGRLPEIIGQALLLGRADGIVDNSVFSDRIVGFFPRRKLLVLGKGTTGVTS